MEHPAIIAREAGGLTDAEAEAINQQRDKKPAIRRTLSNRRRRQRHILALEERATPRVLTGAAARRRLSTKYDGALAVEQDPVLDMRSHGARQHQ
jgi:hypothetical protein